MTKQKKYSAKEKLEIFQAYFERLHFHRYLTMDEKKINEMLRLADTYVEAHSKIADPAEVQNNINKALEGMSKLP